jgi:hypothetical protein
VIRLAHPAHESVSAGDTTIRPTLTLVHVDGVYKVYHNGKPLRVLMSSGKMLAVEFETREAAEGYVRVCRIITAWEQLSRSRP